MVSDSVYRARTKRPLKNSKSIKLHTFEMIPEYLQFNPYILTGYRHCLTIKDCLRSLFYLNNESANIWSHLIGASIFIYLLFHNTILDDSIRFRSSTSNYCFFIFYTLSVIICLLFSVLYHLFGCLSERIFEDFLKLDICGIGVCLLGSYLYGLHILFECFHEWKIRYETVIICLVVLVVIYYVHGVHEDRVPNIHVKLFMCVALSGILPTVHWYYLYGGWSNLVIQEFFPKLFIFYGLLAIGTIFYFTKFPERYFPGYFDYIFSSHQLWHVTSLCAFLWWYFYGTNFLNYRFNNPCKIE